LESALSAGASTKLTVNAVYSHVQTPFPASIGQDEKQLVVYHGNHFVFSPYKTVSQTTAVKLASSTLESHTKEAPTSVSGSTVNYGPYADKPAFSVSGLKLLIQHYLRNVQI
jgi:oligosaccharyltransferase complex subunit alpha (ribophorin I)